MQGYSRGMSVTALCLALALVAVTGCKTVPLVDPPRIEAAPTPELSRVAIIRGLATYYYTVDEESPGRIRARLQNNSWTMIVEILYGRDISVHYADSVSLDYEVRNDVPYIHRNYNYRADDLVKEIQRQIVIVTLEAKGLPPAAGPAKSPPPPPAPARPSTSPPPPSR